MHLLMQGKIGFTPLNSKAEIRVNMKPKTVIKTLLIVLLGVSALATLILSTSFRAPDNSQYDQPLAPMVIPEDAISEEHRMLVELTNRHHATAAEGVDALRKSYDQFLISMTLSDIASPNVRFVATEANGVPGEWTISESSDPDCRLLYLHGGGFQVGSPRAYRFFTSEMVKMTGCSVLAIDYRKIPENKVSDCHADTQSAYSWLLDNGPNGLSPVKSLFVAGDSAGGTLTLSVIAWARDNEIRQADGAIAISPMTDAHFATPSMRENIETDPVNGPTVGPFMKIPRFIFAALNRTMTGKPLTDPEISPLLGDLHNLPDTLITTSRHEMLYGDSQRYANKAVAQGRDNLEILVWPRVIHVMPVFGPNVPEAIDARSRIASFIVTRKH